MANLFIWDGNVQKDNQFACLVTQSRVTFKVGPICARSSDFWTKNQRVSSEESSHPVIDGTCVEMTPVNTLKMNEEEQHLAFIKYSQSRKTFGK